MKGALITGAGGFVGRALAQRLLGDASAPVQRLTVVDEQFDASIPWLNDARVVRHEGDFGDPELLEHALAEPVDVVFHLASIPGSLAEREPQLGWRVNLQASLDLLRCIAAKASACRPRVVFASSIAVYGPLDGQAIVDESTASRPALSYGAHKLITEIVLADLSRRGELDGVSLRVPGIVARPLSPTGHGSAFMSDVIRRLCNSEPYECPVSAEACAWWMSLSCCVDNLVLATQLAFEQVPQSRVVQLPAITATVAEVVRAIESRPGAHAAAIHYRPDALIEQIFGRFPPLETPEARALGFVDDGDLPTLIRRAVSAAL